MADLFGNRGFGKTAVVYQPKRKKAKRKIPIWC